MKTIGKLAICAGLGLALCAGFGMPRAEAGTHVSIGIGIRLAPPAPLWEPAPGIRVGFVWTPGYWRWGGHGYIWVGGTWLPRRAGYVYVQPRWVGSRGVWHFQRAYWRALPPPRYRTYIPRRAYVPSRVNVYRPSHRDDRAYRRGYDHGYDRGYVRGNDRGHDRHYVRGNDRGHDRGRGHSRGR